MTAYADRKPGSGLDPAATKILDEADTAVAPITNRVIGVASQAILRSQNAAGETVLGNVVADGLRSAMGTNISVITTGTLRTEKIAKGNITWGSLYAIQPFSGQVMIENLTGSQILSLLERQWESPLPPHNIALSGLTYAWDPAKPPGRKVSNVKIGGIPLDQGATYSVALVDYMASGGDRYSVLAQGNDVRRSGMTDIEVLSSYIGTLPQPVNITFDGRVSLAGAAA